MTPEEVKYQEELKASGVDLPELNADDIKTKADADAKAKDDADEKAMTDEQAKADADDKVKEDANGDGDDIKDKKRSIYTDYKEKKEDLKKEKEARETAERERDEFKTKLEALESAGANKNEIRKAQDDIDAFAEANKLDPEALKTMRDLFLKDFKAPQSLSEEDRKTLEDAKSFVATNRKTVEKQEFEEEFASTLPTLKELFPKATAEEFVNIKKEVDKIAHSKDWNDKTLDYVIFKNKDSLTKLVSPKKRGMEGKNSIEDNVDTPSDFNINVDFSKMTAAEITKWEADYAKLTKSDGLMEDSSGRKIFI